VTDAQILRLIGQNIRRARSAAQLTQEGLAEMADIHWKTLGYIEAGKRDFGVTTLARLAGCLKVSGEQFWEGIESEATKQMALVAKATARKRKS
jgi:transcriptional regulator with XRE-family HTH domain